MAVGSLAAVVVFPSTEVAAAEDLEFSVMILQDLKPG
jgi:hypothetical protein